jgi:hypothetical protein
VYDCLSACTCCTLCTCCCFCACCACICIEYIGVVIVVSQYNCVYYCDTCYIPAAVASVSVAVSAAAVPVPAVSMPVPVSVAAEPGSWVLLP